MLVNQFLRRFSKCISPPSGNKGVSEGNADQAMKDLRGTSSNNDVMPNMMDGISVDVTGLPHFLQTVSGKSGNGTQSLCTQKHSVVPYEDRHGSIHNDAAYGDCVSDV